MLKTVKTALIALAALFVLPGLAAVADESSVPMPEIPAAEGAECVANPDFMRLNHMNLLKHDRDLTMHEGNRSIDFSLKECIDCHVVRDAEGVPVTADNPKHFCRSCHEYAAVRVDCFSCHASRPEIEAAAKLGRNPHQASAMDSIPNIDWSAGSKPGEGGHE